MYQILKQNKERAKYVILFTLIIVFSLLLTVVFKNDEEIYKSKKIDISFEHKELTSIKEFLLTLIKSPFINVNYEIKKIIYISLKCVRQILVT